MDAPSLSSPSLPACTPHLKRVLKSYQAAAMSSLHGPPPNSFMADSASPPRKTPDKSVAGSTDPDSDDPFLAPPPFPIQQPPLFTPPDQSCCDRSETILESHTISCFCVGGERRLCLPQILTTVLRDFTLQQINGVCDDLQIFCSRCNAEQLEVLKVSRVLPSCAPSCGLITKTDAERLCAELLHSSGDAVDEAVLGTFQVPVYHECFGGTHGDLFPDAYTESDAACVRCGECSAMFSPRRFVCHAHRGRENRTCHWGFDSANWRAYVLLDEEQVRGQDVARLTRALDDVKAKFASDGKRKQNPPLVEGAKKKIRAEDEVRLTAMMHPYMAFGLDPALWYQSQVARASAFKPWNPALLKDRKLPPHLSAALPQNIPVYLKNSVPYPMFTYVSGEVPAELHKVTGVKPDPERQSQPCTPLLVTLPKHHKKRLQLEGELKAEVTEKTSSGRLSIDGEETMSSSSLSTLSGMEEASMPEDDSESIELRGLYTVLERHSVDEKAKQDILQEVQHIILECRKRFSEASTFYHPPALKDMYALPSKALRSQCDTPPTRATPSKLLHPLQVHLPKDVKSVVVVDKDVVPEDKDLAGYSLCNNKELSNHNMPRPLIEKKVLVAA
ncbi:ski oncogene-like [Ornithodoros turicata]